MYFNLSIYRSKVMLETDGRLRNEGSVYLLNFLPLEFLGTEILFVFRITFVRRISALLSLLSTPNFLCLIHAHFRLCFPLPFMFKCQPTCFRKINLHSSFLLLLTNNVCRFVLTSNDRFLCWVYTLFIFLIRFKPSIRCRLCISCLTSCGN